MIFHQIFDMVNIGIIILDENMSVTEWNRWMETHSKIPRQRIIGKPLFEFFPHLDNKSFLRNFKSVFKFGSFAFFSQKLHGHLFPFKPVSAVGGHFEFMQQSCTMAPLRDECNMITNAFIMVQDVTDVAAYQSKLIEMNTKDGLTGVYNRRYLETRLKEEFVRHKRYHCPFSIIIQDIDFFKKVNDEYGHQGGDFILIYFTKTILKRLRNVDIFARYGGEEFCCLLPETGLKQAAKVAEDIRKIIEEKCFIFEDREIRITLSQGVAKIDEDMNSPDELLKKADEALYKAKNTGRNRVLTTD